MKKVIFFISVVAVFAAATEYTPANWSLAGKLSKSPLLYKR